MKKDCMFQYFGGTTMIEDTGLITLKEAKQLFNKHLESFKKALERSKEHGYGQPEMAIWNKCTCSTNYHSKLIHLDSDCFVENNILYQTKPVFQFVEEG